MLKSLTKTEYKSTVLHGDDEFFPKAEKPMEGCEMNQRMREAMVVMR